MNEATAMTHLARPPRAWARDLRWALGLALVLGLLGCLVQAASVSATLAGIDPTLPPARSEASPPEALIYGIVRSRTGDRYLKQRLNLNSPQMADLVRLLPLLRRHLAGEPGLGEVLEDQLATIFPPQQVTDCLDAWPGTLPAEWAHPHLYLALESIVLHECLPRPIGY